MSSSLSSADSQSSSSATPPRKSSRLLHRAFKSKSPLLKEEPRRSPRSRKGQRARHGHGHGQRSAAMAVDWSAGACNATGAQTEGNQEAGAGATADELDINAENIDAGSGPHTVMSFRRLYNQILQRGEVGEGLLVATGESGKV